MNGPINVAKPVAKFLVAAAGVLALAVQIVSDGVITGEEIGMFVGGALTAFGVWRVPNAEAA